MSLGMRLTADDITLEGLCHALGARLPNRAPADAAITVVTHNAGRVAPGAPGLAARYRSLLRSCRWWPCPHEDSSDADGGRVGPSEAEKHVVRGLARD